MKVATSSSRIEVGVRDLKNNLSRYLDRVAQGDEVVVTERGRPVARLTAVDAEIDKLAALVASGAVRMPASNSRRRPRQRIASAGPVSDLVAEQRR
jgi:prevent-host-death family protein